MIKTTNSNQNIEWKKELGDDAYCPTCGRYDWAGHKPNCPWYRKSQHEGAGPVSHR